MKFNFDPLTLLRGDEEREGDIARLRVLVDPVTGLWNNAYRYATIVLAQQWAAQTGEPLYYLEADLSNLGGVNEVLGSNTLSNRLYLAPVAHMWRVRTEQIARQGELGWSLAFRHGGDEVSALIGGVLEEPADKSNGHPISGPLDGLHRDVIEYGRMVGLDKTPHPKGGKQGIGLYYGFTRVTPGEDPEQAFSRADQRVAIYKRRWKQS